MRRPIVLIPACSCDVGSHANHVVQRKYVDAVVIGADCVPMILPALGEATDLETVLGMCDGIMLTGAASNVHPSHYAEDVRDPSLPQDPLRDATTLPLIRAALRRGIPIFSICRGFQEMNVALGGSLHQAVQEVEGHFDHRENEAHELDAQYGPAHPVALEPLGLMERILGAGDIQVNSLHGQGVNKLAPGLAIEARAPDGLVEAFSVPGAAAFALALQWHPEWHIRDNPVSMKLFGAFGAACRAYQAARPGRASA
ncbi:MAG: gamma-glutamyl-gamma-aminobutyrate hydrolase [Massilia sp.]|nr:gamma-glutamyl-gamma-aminobutyrate hydrolase [Massilia sp.]